MALNMSAATAQVFGLIIVALGLTLAATKLVADYLMPRRNGDAKASPKKPAHGNTGSGGLGVRRVFFRRSGTQGGPAGLGSQPPTAPKQESVIEKPPEARPEDMPRTPTWLTIMDFRLA